MPETSGANALVICCIVSPRSDDRLNAATSPPEQVEPLSKQRIYGCGISGVIFKEGQFNPAVSKRPQFSREFLCPSDPARWHMAEQGVRQALAGSENPFIETPWEKEHGLSLVVGFYYPGSVQAKSARRSHSSGT